MNENTWTHRIDALKITEQHLLQRERRCAVRETALVRAVEEGVNARAEKQLLDIIDRELDKLPPPFSIVRALDELGSVAAEIDSMRRSLVIEAEDVALERHRLRIWAEQLHAAFASLNARSTELQMEARRLSGLPQASIQLAQHQQKTIALANAQIENQIQQRQQALDGSNKQHPLDNVMSHGPVDGIGGDLRRADVLARREEALNERERHVTELFRYVLEQRTLAERQLELIGERIQLLTAAPDRSTSRSQQQPYCQHPLLSAVSVAATAADGVGGGAAQDTNSNHNDDDDDGVDYGQ